MMNAVSPKPSIALVLSDVHVPAPATQRGIDAHAWNALKNSVYKGASDSMILLAIDYCKARKFDPLMKPVHIVKTYDTESRSYVEGIWPGIHLHRSTAARTAEYAGQDEPVFGPMVTERLGAREVTFPEWCKVTVYRLRGGHKCAYSGLVYFTEAVAMGKDGPNRMWTKRPRGQLAKCAEAEALRKAFPEETGGDPTAEEIGGEPGDHARDITPAAEQPRRSGGKLDALESAIEADAAPASMPADETFGLPAIENGEVVEDAPLDALTPEQERAQAWGNKVVRALEKEADAAEIDAWMERNKAKLAEIHNIAPDVAVAIVGAADARKRQLGAAA